MILNYMSIYQHKYNKYKNKYIQLKQFGSSSNDVKCNEILNQALKKNLNVYELNINDTWKFNPNTKFPKDVLLLNKDELLQGKIWFIKKSTRMLTYKNQKGELLKDYKFPIDLCVLKNIYSENELDEMYSYFGKLFGEYRKYDIEYSYQKERGLTYLFTGNKGVVQYSEKTLAFLKEYNIDLYNIINELVKHIFNVFCLSEYGITDNDLLKKMQIILLKYESETGIWLHIDNVARYDQGPIITVSIGPDKIYYDLTPTLLYEKDKSLKPIRVEIDNGDIVVMDGSSRMEWAHGLPFNMNYDKTKYSILLKFDKFGEYNKIYNDTLDTYITTSKLLC